MKLYMYLLNVHLFIRAIGYHDEKVQEKLTESTHTHTKVPRYRIVNKSKNVSWATIAKVNNEELCPF